MRAEVVAMDKLGDEEQGGISASAATAAAAAAPRIAAEYTLAPF